MHRDHKGRETESNFLVETHLQCTAPYKNDASLEYSRALLTAFLDWTQTIGIKHSDLTELYLDPFLKTWAFRSGCHNGSNSVKLEKRILKRYLSWQKGHTDSVLNLRPKERKGSSATPDLLNDPDFIKKLHYALGRSEDIYHNGLMRLLPLTGLKPRYLIGLPVECLEKDEKGRPLLVITTNCGINRTPICPQAHDVIQRLIAEAKKSSSQNKRLWLLHHKGKHLTERTLENKLNALNKDLKAEIPLKTCTLKSIFRSLLENRGLYYEEFLFLTGVATEEQILREKKITKMELYEHCFRALEKLFQFLEIAPLKSAA